MFLQMESQANAENASEQRQQRQIADDDEDFDEEAQTLAVASSGENAVRMSLCSLLGKNENGGSALRRDFDMNSLPEDDGLGIVSSPCAKAAANSSQRKKLRLSKEQAAILEECFRQHHTLNPKQKNALAKQLNLESRQVEVWFQNRRARTKVKQTEVDCELLKRCCENLTQENTRLKKEIEELRRMKVASSCIIGTHVYMPLPQATLAMCPSCKRVGMGSISDKRAFQFVKPPTFHLRPSPASC